MFSSIIVGILVFLCFLVLDKKVDIFWKLSLVIAHVHVWIWKKRTGPAFGFDHKSQDLGKLGVISTPEALEKDNPRIFPANINAADSLAFCGVSQDGCILVTRITRRHDRLAETWVYLKLSSGEEFQLANHPDTKIFNTGDRCFSAGGLTFEILEPLRRYRVMFNGYLRKVVEADWNNNDNNTVLVRFSFLWFPIDNYLAFPNDFHNSFLAEVVAKQLWIKGLTSPFTIFSEESTEQQGELLGKVTIEDEEPQELLLRGLRQRKHGVVNWSTVRNKISLQGILNNGSGFHVFAEKTDDRPLKEYLYGYVLPPCNMLIHHIQKFSISPDSLFQLSNWPEKILISFSAGNNKYALELCTSEGGFSVREGPQWNFKIDVKPLKVKLNGKEGYGIVEFGYRQQGSSPMPMRSSLPLLKEPEIKNCCSFVLPFDNVACRSSSIVGGKGASLANLSILPYKSENFIVPDGVCLTKAAFELYLAKNPEVKLAILRMQDVAWKRSEGSLSDECESVVKLITGTDIPQKVKNELKSKLLSVFGEELETIKFAVRSSAIGEDSDELSAAGQNETFLGVRTSKEICSSIVKCWASQFSFRSVEYKRQNGQLLNAGMGIVIQKMVPAEVAGVLFTRDPLTGSRGMMAISSNFGLGESVVSATADPDAITLRRSWNDKLSVLRKEIGTKTYKISLSDDSGTVLSEVDTESASKCTLSDEMAIKLGKVALFIEQCFGNARDIEWAIYRSQIYLLQSRPLTTENMMTEFDILHEFDSGLPTNQEYMTTANVSEVLPGSMTPLSQTAMLRINSIFFQERFSWKIESHRFDPTTWIGFFSHYGQPFFDQVQQKAWALEKTKSAMNKAMEIGLYGRVLDDNDVLQTALERFSSPPLKARLVFGLVALRGMLFGNRILRQALKKYQQLTVPTDGAVLPSEAYAKISETLPNQSDVIDAHMTVSLASTAWNLIVLQILSNGSKDYTMEQYTDFALLIGSGLGTESGDVPYSLKDLAATISKEVELKKFTSWTAEEAFIWLCENVQESGKKFKEFLERHGHRGIRECELISLTWGLDPIGVVQIVQDMLKGTVISSQTAKEINIDSLLNTIKTQLTKFRRMLITFVLKRCYNGIRQREIGKSLVVKCFHYKRLAYRRLAEMMVSEGMLPDENLIFFLTHEEIDTIIRTRSANVLRRAKQRCHLYPKMNALKFPEMIVGYPKPIEDDEAVSYDTTNFIKGFPVSQGVVQGPARVVLSFLDIGTIKAGEILITRATDIGWSPYFPMLAGVVTEIGGLISHGAVVAREFGLPCIVGAQNATKAFKTGDKVVLDATKGILSKVV